MKTVFGSHYELAHIWASQSQASGRGSRMFFENGIIYSYGYHFPIARFAPEYGQVVLFTNRGYSNSTAKHKSLARAAIPDNFRIVYCDDPSRSVTHNLDIWARRVERLRADFAAKSHKVTRGNLAHQIAAEIRAAVEYCNAVDIRRPQWALDDPQAERDARAYSDDLVIRRAAKKAERDAERAKLAAMKAEEKMELWLAGQNVPLDHFYRIPVALRIKGENIETSRGARIPVSEALALWPLLLRAKMSNYQIERGRKIGAYSFTSFDGNTLTVGCHSIPWNELEKMAIQLNLLEKAA